MSNGFTSTSQRRRLQVRHARQEGGGHASATDGSKELTAYRRPRSPHASCRLPSAGRRNPPQRPEDRPLSVILPCRRRSSDLAARAASPLRGSAPQKWSFLVRQFYVPHLHRRAAVRSTPGVSRLDGSHARVYRLHSRGGRSAPRRPWSSRSPGIAPPYRTTCHRDWLASRRRPPVGPSQNRHEAPSQSSTQL